MAAIFAADVVGYSRLMGADEVGTLLALKAFRREIIDPTIGEHKGRIVKTIGDGLLVEFASAVDAVTCATTVQLLIAERNQGAPNITFRIGINVGEIIIDDDDIFGDGVNIAARLESIATPGGVCISDDTFRQIRNRVEAPFEDGGYQSLKNIAEPIRVWRYNGTNNATAPKASKQTAGIMREGPSVAVLPFNNMSSDPEQEYFADGMVEDIITALARYPSLFIVARNSSFAYKGKSPDIRVVGRDLGVRYVLEGSIRRAAQKVRINSQLIEADTGRHLWAEKYDGVLEDIFELQDRIVSNVVGTVGPQIGEAEIARALSKPSNSLSAYEVFLRSKFAFRKMTRAGLDEAVADAEKALEMDPGFAAAAVAAANARGYRVASGRSSDDDADIAGCLNHARRALELDPFNVEAMAMAGRCFACFGEHQAGIELAEQACRDYPYSAIAWMEAGWTNLYCARPQHAIECIRHAQALSPRDPTEHDRVGVTASALNQLGEYEQAISAARQSIRLNANVPGHHRALITALALSGNIEEARRSCEGLFAVEPAFRVSDWDKRSRWVPEAKAAALKAYRLVGLPE
ncbi:adenylate/guanylate cyclase domain-containing protein [Frankia sp. RB7]|nr:adenylate/guanylate cyclase domain-containing protein [Frankia sp. RB7]